MQAAPDPKLRVLIVVDAQKGFVTPSSEPVLGLLETLQSQFDRVILTKFHNPDPSPFRRILNYCELAPDSEDAGLAIVPRQDAVIVSRALYTCITAELLDILRTWGVDEVYMAGIATEACVLKTALDLFEADIRPIVIADACASDKNDRFHTMAIELITSLIGTENVVNSGTVSGRSRAA